MLEVAERSDEAFEAARDAWRADPSHRFHARTFAKLASARQDLAQEDAALAVEALDVVLAGRVPRDGAVPEAQRRRLATDLELASRVRVAAGLAEAAVDGQRLASTLDPTPRRTVGARLGLGPHPPARPLDPRSGRPRRLLDA